MEAVYVPKQNEDHWDSYWKKSNFKHELELCETDGLVPIFNQYLRKGTKIVEAGCGLGKWVIYLYTKGYDITGIDTNSYALKALHTYSKEVSTIQASVEDMPLSANSIDTYISLGVVEHIQDGPVKALQEAYRVLKQGGYAIVEVPFDNVQRQVLRLVNQGKVSVKTPIRKLFEKLGLKKERSKIETEFYEYHYTKEEMKTFMEKAGFTIEKWYPKDDTDPDKSIGLWLDFPSLRNEINVADFRLSPKGKWIKKLYTILSLQWVYSACIVCIAVKK